MIKPRQPDQRVVDVLVALDDGVITSVEDAALMGGMTVEECQAAIDDPIMYAHVKAEQTKRKLTGRGARQKAKVALDDLVSTVADKISDPETPVGTLVRAGEFLHRVSGMDAEQSAELRNTTNSPSAEIFVLNPGDPDPPPHVPGAYRMVIDLRGKNREKVIGDGDAE